MTNTQNSSSSIPTWFNRIATGAALFAAPALIALGTATAGHAQGLPDSQNAPAPSGLARVVTAPVPDQPAPAPSGLRRVVADSNSRVGLRVPDKAPAQNAPAPAPNPAKNVRVPD